jgi:hypothetical protein
LRLKRSRSHPDGDHQIAAYKGAPERVYDASRL